MPHGPDFATTSLELRCLSPDPGKPALALDITSHTAEVEQIEFQAKILTRPLRGRCLSTPLFWGPGRRSDRPLSGRRLGPGGRVDLRSERMQAPLVSGWILGNCYRESTELCPLASLRVNFGTFPVTCPAKIRPRRAIYDPEALLHDMESLPKKKPGFQRASCFPIALFQWRPEPPSMMKAKVQKTQVSP